MIKYLKYLRYLLRHKWYVGIECFKRGLYWRGIIHDMSKFRPAEFIPYTNFFYGKGRGTRQRTLLNKYGFPRGYLSRQKNMFGFQNNDYIKIEVPKGKHEGEYTGYVIIRRTGYFDIRDASGNNLLQGISYKYCHLIQRYSGYKYERRQRSISLRPKE